MLLEAEDKLFDKKSRSLEQKGKSVALIDKKSVDELRCFDLEGKKSAGEVILLEVIGM